MKKDFWGQAIWTSLHISAIIYKPENRLSFKQFVSSLTVLLPCKVCRQHLVQNLQVIPLDDRALSSNKNLFIWSYLLHDLVNKQLKKKSPDFMSIENHYFKISSHNNLWGAYFWRMIHSFAASYPQNPSIEHKTAFRQFVYSLTGIIPCKVCREHYIKNLTQIPLTDEYLESTRNVFLWTYLLHDLTNKQLKKNSPSFEQIREQYFNNDVCEKCTF